MTKAKDTDDVFEAVERMRTRFAAERDKALRRAAANSGSAIDAALNEAMMAQRRLCGFLNDVVRLSGRHAYVSQIRRPLDFYVGSDDLRRRLRALRGPTMPSAKLPPDAVKVLDELRAMNIEPSGPVIKNLEDLTPEEIENLRNPPGEETVTAFERRHGVIE